MNQFEITTHLDFDDHEVVEVIDTGELKAIIAVHNSRLGPAVGGCRMYPYASDRDALSDVLLLSRGMTYKSALAGLPLGGGKSVIIADPSKDKTTALLHAFGEHIERLNGRYVTAEDSGTGVEDMAVIGEKTSYVSGNLPGERFGGDPSPRTAYGLFLAITEAVSFRYRSDLNGMRVAVQGAGHVGLRLVEWLIDAGALVTVADVNKANVNKAGELGATIVSPADIAAADAEVFAPCALGGTLNESSLRELRAGIIAGAANNQLASRAIDQRLAEMGVLYAPDYVVNAGGIIDIYYQRAGERSADVIDTHIKRIVPTLNRIFATAAKTHRGTGEVADTMAEAIFMKGYQAVA